MKPRVMRSLKKAARVVFRPHFDDFVEDPEGIIRRYVHNVIGYTDEKCTSVQIVASYYEEQAARDEIKKNPQYWYQRILISDAQPEEYPLREVEWSMAPRPFKRRSP